MHAARVESAQPGRDVQTLERPVAVHHAEAVAATGPAHVPRHLVSDVARGLRRPRVAGADAAAAREPPQQVAIGIAAAVGREQPLELAAVAVCEAHLHAPRALAELLETPLP